MDVASSLNEILRETLEVLKTVTDVLPHWCASLRSLAEGASGERHRVGVVGVTSSGKSTFINALLGEELLPEQSKATTNVPVICRKGPERKLVVTFHSRKKPQEYKNDAVTSALIKSLCSEDGNPENKKGVRHLSLELPDCWLPSELEIIDTPGTDAFDHDDHEITLYECVPGFDIIVFMTHIVRPFAASDVNLLKKILENDQRVLFAISHSDVEKDDFEKNQLSRSRAKKLDNHVKELHDKLAHFPELKGAGVVAISSHYAKLAGRDRKSEYWRNSNFDKVLYCFNQFVHEFSDVIIRERQDRLRKFLPLLMKTIQEEATTLETQPTKTLTETALALEIEKLKVVRQAITGHISELQETVASLLDLRAALLSMMSPFSQLQSTDIWGFQQEMDRVPHQWRVRIGKVTPAIDTAKLKCQQELDEIGLTLSRSTVKKRALGTEEFPSLKRQIKEKTETYEVEVPRTGWFFPKTRDRLFGLRTEYRTTTTTYVDVQALERDLESSLEAAISKWSTFVKEQAQMLSDLYLDPVVAQLNERNSQLSDLIGFRAAAKDKKDLFLSILARLNKISTKLEEIRCHELPPVKDVILPGNEAEPQSPQPPVVVGEGNSARNLMISLLLRVREGVAINRFWQVAVRASRTNDFPKRLLVVGMEMDEVWKLIGYLTRTNKPSDQLRSSSINGISEMQLTHSGGKTSVIVIPTARSVSRSVVHTQCTRADVIAVHFHGAQPSAGLKRLIQQPYYYYDILQEFAAKAFLVVPGGGTYATRLHNLVREVVFMVKENTPFSLCPWYVYEAGEYDARYTDFIEIVEEVSGRAGSEREISREWKIKKLSTRAPFDEKNLKRAYREIRGEGKNADG